tara:strand:- start:89 stop:934 length:846 start_codon:yes stop_codon:yes gene_type:complete
MKKHMNRLIKFFSARNNKKNNNFGYVEFVSLGEISGWAYSPLLKINYIGFFLDDDLITYSELNQKRDDINLKFKIDMATGFRILFDYKMGRKKNKKRPIVCALDSNKKILFELKLIQTIKNKKLKEIHQSPYFGCDGRFDGINEGGTISGWASKRGLERKLGIWLQSDQKIDPKEVCCNIWRQDLKNYQVEDCGFEIDPIEIPYAFGGSNIYFSFDKEGKYNIDPNNKKLYLEKRTVKTSSNKSSNQKPIIEISKKSETYNKQIRTLNEFKELLNKIEERK